MEDSGLFKVLRGWQQEIGILRFDSVQAVNAN